MSIANHKQNLIGTSESHLRKILHDWQPYRIHQIFNWIYHYGCRDFSEMTNLSKVMRAQLADLFYFSLPKIQNKTYLFPAILKIVICSTNQL